MRLDLNSELKKQLDDVRKREPHVYGRGHGETIRFLLAHYRTAGPLTETAAHISNEIDRLWAALDEKMTEAMTKTLTTALTNLVTNLLKPAQTSGSGRAAERTPASSDRARSGGRNQR